MRDFTPEEKELIINTPITIGCFDNLKCLTDIFNPEECGINAKYWLDVIGVCEWYRIKYRETTSEKYFDRLIEMLPNSYKVVKLYAERKDICKAKHIVSKTPHYGKESRGVPCYSMRSCNDCRLFKESKK